MKKVLIILGILGVLMLALSLAVFGVLYTIGTKGPETFVVPGAQMREDQVATIRELGLLKEGEEIRYFYSDALLDIRDGMYFVTDRRLVLYDDEWEKPTLAAPFASIVDVEAEWNDSLFIDSMLTVTIAIGEIWTFPVSSERGGDKLVFEYLRERIADEER